MAEGGFEAGAESLEMARRINSYSDDDSGSDSDLSFQRRRRRFKRRSVAAAGEVDDAEHQQEPFGADNGQSNAQSRCFRPRRYSEGADTQDSDSDEQPHGAGEANGSHGGYYSSKNEKELDQFRPSSSVDADNARDDQRPNPQRRPSLASALVQYGIQSMRSRPRRDDATDGIRPSLASIINSNRRPSLFTTQRRHSDVTKHIEDLCKRRRFIRKLAQSLLAFGAPSHRIESQLHSACQLLKVDCEFVHLPNLIIVSFNDEERKSSETHFVRASGRIALSSLHKVHVTYRQVLHDKMGAQAGTDALRKILRAPPRYSLPFRCGLSFISATVLCSLAFRGSLLDMLVGGASSSVLQFLGLNAAAKSAIYANVYEITITILMSFFARGLSTIHDDFFCYTAIASTGVASVLPGFTVLIAALELTSSNILCGSVRMVYAIIYTLFLGFGLTIGSGLYTIFDPHAEHVGAHQGPLETVHGHFIPMNGTESEVPFGGTFAFYQPTSFGSGQFINNCYRDGSWPWWRQPLPWWTLFIFVPVYSTCSALTNLQSWRGKQFPVMILFSCAAYAANKATGTYVSTRGDVISATGAFVIGVLGNAYSRIVRGTAFTVMVPGVLFLVPSALGQGGGIITTYQTSAEQYGSGFTLGLRMVQIAVGIVIGLFASQMVVYAFGTRKNAAYFAF